ncbi:MAG: hypothetical protein LRZ85_00015 [Alphaproteobacteria bacterium]|nr:hypothetical protein [Alphaproteobacteria bacterium]MCD8526567.1 hypothetical protein [Alphaproteobacteria bacterium]MCD8571319.1 hypothetical protein [Alphaproteobacteria bacterium]
MRILALTAALLLTACSTCPATSPWGCKAGDLECLKEQEQIRRDAGDQLEAKPILTEIDRANRDMR